MFKQITVSVVFTHTHTHTHKHALMHACMHARMHTRTHANKHTHTHTHTHTELLFRFVFQGKCFLCPCALFALFISLMEAVDIAITSNCIDISMLNSVQFNLKNFNYPTRGKFVAVMFHMTSV